MLSIVLNTAYTLLSLILSVIDRYGNILILKINQNTEKLSNILKMT